MVGAAKENRAELRKSGLSYMPYMCVRVCTYECVFTCIYICVVYVRVHVWVHVCARVGVCEREIVQGSGNANQRRS